MLKAINAGFYFLSRRTVKQLSKVHANPTKCFWTSSPVKEDIAKPQSKNESASKVSPLTRKDIAMTIAEDHDVSFAKADRILKSVFDMISEQVATKKEEVFISGFGKFKPSIRDARTARNPSTGEEIKVPRKASAKFQASKALKELCNSK